jgi:hypothetical protein
MIDAFVGLLLIVTLYLFALHEGMRRIIYWTNRYYSEVLNDEEYIYIFVAILPGKGPRGF